VEESSLVSNFKPPQNHTDLSHIVYRRSGSIPFNREVKLGLPNRSIQRLHPVESIVTACMQDTPFDCAPSVTFSTLYPEDIRVDNVALTVLFVDNTSLLESFVLLDEDALRLD
jgi:hypothetical protein